MTNYIPGRDERETIILIFPTQEHAEISTNDPVYIRRLDKLSRDYPEAYQCIEVTPYGEKAYRTPKGFISFKKPQSSAQQEARLKALEKMQAAKSA